MTEFRVADRDLFGWQDPVLDKDLTAPPGSPSEGDRYIVGPSPTGDWSGHENDIAEYVETSWEFYTPVDGWRVDVTDENALYRFSGTAWISGGVGGNDTGLIEWVANGPINAGTNEDGIRVMPKSGNIVAVYMSIEGRGNNGDTIVDISKGTPGTPHTTQQNATALSTIYTTQANRPTLTGLTGNGGDNAFIKATLPDVTAFAAGDMFVMDIDESAPLASTVSVLMEVEYA